MHIAGSPSNASAAPRATRKGEGGDIRSYRQPSSGRDVSHSGRGSATRPRSVRDPRILPKSGIVVSPLWPDQHWPFTRADPLH